MGKAEGRIGDTVHWYNSRTGVSSEKSDKQKTMSGDEIMDMFFTKMADHNKQYKRKLAAMPWWKRMYHKTLNKIDKMIPDED